MPLAIGQSPDARHLAFDIDAALAALAWHDALQFVGCGLADREQPRLGRRDRPRHQPRREIDCQPAVVRRPDKLQPRPERLGARHLAAIPVADALAIYLTDVAARTSRPTETAYRVKRLLLWWGERSFADVGGQSCRAYVRERGADAAARQELENLRAAINHHRREGLCSEIVEVALLEKPAPRE